MRTSLQTVYACRYMSVAAHSCLDHGVLPYSLTVFVCVWVCACEYAYVFGHDRHGLRFQASFLFGGYGFFESFISSMKKGRSLEGCHIRAEGGGGGGCWQIKACRKDSGPLVGLACGFSDGWPGWTYASDWLQLRFPPDHHPHCFVLVPAGQCLEVVRHLVCRAFVHKSSQVACQSCLPLTHDSCQDQILLCQPCESTQPVFHDLYYQPSRCPI